VYILDGLISGIISLLTNRGAYIQVGGGGLLTGGALNMGFYGA